MCGSSRRHQASYSNDAVEDAAAAQRAQRDCLLAGSPPPPGARIPATMLTRRRIISGAAAGLAAASGATAQMAAPPRAGFLAMGQHPSFEVFSSGLRELGYRPGQNIVLEPRFAEPGRPEQFEALAADLVRQRVQVIVALINPEIAASRRATSKIPIVMVVSADPVRQGFVRSLAKPDGNVTGLAWDPDPAIYGKMIELIESIVPEARRVGGVVDAKFPASPPYWNAANEVASRRHMRLQRADVERPENLEQAFASMKQARVEAIFVFGGSMLFGARSADRGACVEEPPARRLAISRRR